MSDGQLFGYEMRQLLCQQEKYFPRDKEDLAKQHHTSVSRFPLRSHLAVSHEKYLVQVSH